MLLLALRLMFFSPNTIGISMPEAIMILLEAVIEIVEAVIELTCIPGIFICSQGPSSPKLAFVLFPLVIDLGVKVTV